MIPPTVRRRRLGAKLRSLREEQGLTLDDVANRLPWLTIAKLSRLEIAQSGAKPSDINALLDFYGVEEPELRDALLSLTRTRKQPGWVRSYRAVLSPVYEELICLEAEATSVQNWQLAGIPGLLQTHDYAREITIATSPTASGKANADALADIRVARQAVLTRPERPLQLHALISEAALLTTCAEGVMYEQLGRLLTMGARDTITVQVVPLDAPLHIGLVGNHSLLRFPVPGLDVVHVENVTSLLHVEEATQVDHYRRAYDTLSAIALSPEQSAERIKQIRESRT